MRVSLHINILAIAELEHIKLGLFHLESLYSLVILPNYVQKYNENHYRVRNIRYMTRYTLFHCRRLSRFSLNLFECACTERKIRTEKFTSGGKHDGHINRYKRRSFRHTHIKLPLCYLKLCHGIIYVATTRISHKICCQDNAKIL